MKAITSLYRTLHIDPNDCPLRKNLCVNGQTGKKCEYYDHTTERRDKEHGWTGYTLYCKCTKAPKPIQLTLFDW